MTPCSSIARSWSSRVAVLIGGLAIMSNITENALSRAAPTMWLRCASRISA